jgi:hypothetical protein
MTAGNAATDNQLKQNQGRKEDAECILGEVFGELGG